MNNIFDDTSNNCTSCLLCAAVCPKGAIGVVIDDEGFQRPGICEDLCVSCGICKQNCIKYAPFSVSDNKNIKSFAAYNNDGEVLKNSSSGGISDALMKALVNAGYKIAGVKYDYSSDSAIHSIATCDSDLDSFKGSKYMQSYTLAALREIISSSDDKIAFFGTPCQIFALSSWAKAHRQDNRFIFIDFFCHGTPSRLLWDSYIKSYKEKLHTEHFGKIDFRTKAHGWHEFSFVFSDPDEKQKILSKKSLKDFFYTVFFDDEILNESCYTCKFKTNFAYEDIRFGDFWGEKYEKNSKGVSAVLICSEKGKKLWDSIKSSLTIEDANLDDILKEQPLHDKKYNKEMRENTLNLLRSGSPDMKKYLKLYSPKKRLFRAVKIFANDMPKPFRLFAKRIYRKIFSFFV